MKQTHSVRKIAHIINPVVVNEESDLFIAQPVTFATMASARDFARGKVDVLLFTAQYPEDRSLVPADFQATPDLERSVLDLGSFRQKRKLPFIKDILDRLYEAAPEAEYLIYTNVDIALKSEFYVAVNTFIGNGCDAFVINRRTIGNYQSIEEIQLMYADPGESHPGWDCFVFKREAYPRFILGDICVGANLIGAVLLFNLICTSRNFMEFKNEHLTFHLGDDRVWESDNYSDYAAHNLRQTEKIISELERADGCSFSEGPYSYVLTHISNLQKEQEAKQCDASPVMAANKLRQRVICITGMARSGTSMVAKILNIMGLYLGPEESLILETDYNVKGCWEHKRLLEISNKITSSLGWHGLQAPDWPQSPGVVALEDEARSVISRDFAGVDFWGWKDDRCSLTLPFWRKILPQLECIICVRNPLDVANSLLKQRWVGCLEEGLNRWLIFISSVIKYTQGRPRIIVFYDDFLGDGWEDTIASLGAFLGHSFKKRQGYEKELEGLINRKLRHHKATLHDTLAHREVPFAVKYFYLALINIVKLKKYGDYSDFGHNPDEILFAIASHANDEAYRLNERYLKLVGKNNETAGLSDHMKRKECKISSVEASERKESEYVRSKMTDILTEKDREIATRSGAVQELERRIADIENSLSWKITAPLRRIYEILSLHKKGK